MPCVRNKARSANRKRLRQMLLDALGNVCTLQGPCCEPHLTLKTLEVHHVDGCTWNQRGCNAEHRLYRYLRELREGVKLAAACRSCNGALNQTVFGTRAEDEVPFYCPSKAKFPQPFRTRWRRFSRR